MRPQSKRLRQASKIPVKQRESYPLIEKGYGHDKVESVTSSSTFEMAVTKSPHKESIGCYLSAATLDSTNSSQYF